MPKSKAPPQKTTRARKVKKPRRRALPAATTDAIFAAFEADNPEPKGELDYINTFTLLVAVVLSAQATDIGVNRATGPLFAIADTAEKMAALSEDTVREYIKTIGLYRNKAKNVIAMSERLRDVFNGEVPADRDMLQTLPGVGRKTANVVLNIAFGQPTIAVDTHLFRVSNRTGMAPGDTPLDVEERLLQVTPARYLQHAHHWLILHGRYTCIARKPKCPVCIIAEHCRFKEKTEVL